MKRPPLFRVIPGLLMVSLGIPVIVLVLLLLLFRNMAVTGMVEKHLVDSLISIRDYSGSRTEFPVSALLVYGDSIMGAGYNTFIEKNDPTGHAEINAIRDAFESISYQDFRKLDYRKLLLLTSYEPCLMCKGICSQYGIKRIYYIQKRPSKLRWRQLKIDFLSNFRVRRLKVRSV